MISDDNLFNYKEDNLKHTGFKSIKVPTLDTSFIFSEGNWISEINPHSKIYYTGEEVETSLLAYLKGFDIYTPKQIVAWHGRTNNLKLKLSNTQDLIEVTDSYHKSIHYLQKALLSYSKTGDIFSRTVKEYEQYIGHKFNSVISEPEN